VKKAEKKERGYFETFAVNPTFVIIIGVSKSSFSFSKISKNCRRRTVLNVFSGKSLIWPGTSFKGRRNAGGFMK